MEGIPTTRAYTAPAAMIRRTLRRETRSIAEWREKGKHAPYDLAAAAARMPPFPDRAATWHGPERKSTWSPASSVEYYDQDSDSEYSGSEEEDDYTYGKPTWSVLIDITHGDVAERHEDDRIPRSDIPAAELFAEEPIAADIPEEELESSRRRSIELERQPLFLDNKEEDVVPVEEIVQHLADPSLGPVAETKASAPSFIDIPKVEEVDTSDPPSPEDIIELPRPSPPKPKVPAISARDRFLKAKKVLFTVDVLKKCIPPAPPPDELIPDTYSKPKAKPVKKVVEPVAQTPVKEKEVVEAPAPKVEVEEQKAEKTGIMEPVTVVEAPKKSASPAPKPTVGEPAPKNPSGVLLFPEPTLRSDEGYLSGESDNESDFGVSLAPAMQNAEAPLPEDIIATAPHVPRENEPYQHHCLIHGHFFPKAGPLRSAVPGEPFTPWISCDRCQRPRLCEAWQCSLLNQCGMIVCTPCHDELEYGAIKKPSAIVLEARVDGVKQGLELGMQRGLKIGFEVGLAGKAKEIVARQEREAAAAKRRSSGADQDGVRGHRSWETAPKTARRQMSMGF